MQFGRSVGSPTEGRLVGGAHLEATPYLRLVPSYAAGDVRWGLEPLVALIDRSARAVRRQFPDAVTSVGHLSRSGGGELERHHSHESGRDADVAFFIRAAKGHLLIADHFVAFRPDGSAASWPGAFFDDARNWAFVQALVSDPQARVTHIFVAAPLRARLLNYAERVGAPANVRVRAAELMVQPRGALPHDDHFHVRIGCPAHMTGCIEYPTSTSHVARHAPRPMPHGRDRGFDHVEPRHSMPVGVARRAPTAHGSEPPVPQHEHDVEGPDTHEVDEAPLGDSSGVPPAAATVPIDDVDGEL
jgi:penicillin-insensitive murein endopeptidase